MIVERSPPLRVQCAAQCCADWPSCVEDLLKQVLRSYQCHHALVLDILLLVLLLLSRQWLCALGIRTDASHPATKTICDTNGCDLLLQLGRQSTIPPQRFSFRCDPPQDGPLVVVGSCSVPIRQ
jgi:hypothetical protein